MSRPPNYEFQEWWNKQREHNHQFFTNDTNNPTNGLLTVQITNPLPDRTPDKDRSRSARQLSWVCLLRLQQLANSLASIAIASLLLLRTANRRIFSPDSSSDYTASRLYRVIKLFLFLVILLLCVELVAFFKGWHFSPPSAEEAEAAVDLVYAKWLEKRADWLAPPLQSLANVCIVLFLVQSVDRVVLILGCFWIKFRKLKPTAAMEYPTGRVEGENVEDYPMVLVQIPMCNEREVYQQSIAAVCIMDWPKERILVQVLDDSDDVDVQLLIKAEVQKWQHRGVHILYRHRLIRTGYKAGNLKSAMSCDYVKNYEFVAIFDADFQPAPDFLKKTIPHFKGHLTLKMKIPGSLVIHVMSLVSLSSSRGMMILLGSDKVNGVFINFFGFNGTAGVWRIKALEDCGGWLERTTVEDMDIAVCLCELPESYEAYKKQQHRWHSGPMQLFRLCSLTYFVLRRGTLGILVCSVVQNFKTCGVAQDVGCKYGQESQFDIPVLSPTKALFYLLLLHLVLHHSPVDNVPARSSTTSLGCLLCPWNYVRVQYLPAPPIPFRSRSSEADLVAYEKESDALMEATSLLRSSSDSGLEELGKLEATKKTLKKRRNHLYRKELALAFVLLTASVRSLLSAQGIHFYFLLFQGISFLVVGLDLIGEQSHAMLNIKCIKQRVLEIREEKTSKTSVGG
ncbi:putative xyloglucan glycosyltransferase 6 [Hibiscus syriacus]|uniref:Xyloglucan glycosyltransferase 6 n=1 Tax=Hibiscus syriacus TaxID=106335 RepID=A0A6A2YBI8_HIBSY|nr:putative xyloglucan glycosyltransferase 6 [Hibiscus syriacus]